MHAHFTLFTAFHKTFYLPKAKYVVPIWAGKNGKQSSLELPGDDTGDNISHLNPWFCELTLLYWVWKNHHFNKGDWWGLCHYRRYFCRPSFWDNKPLRREKPLPQLIDNCLDEKLYKKINALKSTCDVIISIPVHISFDKKNPLKIIEQWNNMHLPQDWQLLKSIVKEKHPAYIPAFEIFEQQPMASVANMMIAAPETWDTYLSWLFDILFEFYKRMEPREDAYQKRTPGFLAERLMNIFIHHNKLKVATLPIKVFDK